MAAFGDSFSQSAFSASAFSFAVAAAAVVQAPVGAGSGRYRKLTERDALEYVEALKQAFRKRHEDPEEVAEQIEEVIEPVRRAFFRYDLPDIRPIVEKAQWERLEVLIARYERLVQEDDDEAAMILL